MRKMICWVKNLVILAAGSLPAQDWFHAGVITPNGTKYTAAGDVNGDGNLDLLAIANGVYTVHLTSPLSIPPGGATVTNPMFARPSNSTGYDLLADVDGDGFSDLIYTTSPQGGVEIMPGQANGTFGAAIAIPTPEMGSSLVAGDCNNDGITDIAFYGFSGALLQGTARWVLGDSNRQFTALPEFVFPPAANLKSIVVLDANGDGFDDVAVSSNSETRIVLTQGSTLVAGPIVTVPGLADHWLAAGDFDGDLDDDLVAAAQDTGGVRVTRIENLGGTFTMTSQLFTEFQIARPYAGDWDGDGDDDVVLRSFYGGYALLAGDGAALSHAWTHHTQTPFTLIHPGMFDADGDGDLDFVDSHAVYPGDGTLNNPQPEGFFKTQDVVDMEDDGDADVTDGVAILQNDGSGQFTDVSLTLPSPGSGMSYGAPVITADFDGDGFGEVLVGLFASPFPYWNFVEMRRLEDTGNGTMVDLGPATAPGERISARAWAVDTNADGHLDIVSVLGLWTNDGSYLFSQHPTSFGGYLAIDAGDVDGDGDLEYLAALNGGTQSLAIIDHTGPHTFAVSVIYSNVSSITTHVPSFADIDDDGDLDLMVDVSLGGSQMQLWLNSGGAFTAGPTVPFNTNGLAGTGRGNCLAADVDGDGRTDLVYSYDERVLVRRRSSAGLTYEDPVAFSTSRKTKFVDIDQDGDPDLLGAYGIMHNNDYAGATAGQRRQFGAAGVGSGNHRPVLGCSGPIRTGEAPVLRLRKAAGGSLTVLTMGYQESNILSPIIPGLVHYGYPFSVALWLTTSGPTSQPAVGTHDLPVLLPPGLVGVSAYFQHHVFDAGAANIVVHSNGLEFTIGG